ncbi:YidH family protein [Spongisporangium articulatum]|uniref:YidH family protein n=1 Tax=Spongisporangium articulatum TaxID=3362603 RepID=A0ABW8ANP2_9ACTN
MDDDPADRRDPDARFLLANERTLLAWLRTGLALQAAGVATFQFGNQLDAQESISLGLIAVGLACHLTGWWRYRAADAAIRANRLPRRGLAPDAIVLGAVVLSVAVGALLLRDVLG